MTLGDNFRSALIIFFLPFVLTLILPVPARAGYDELAEKLNSNEVLSTEFINSLPEPGTPRQHWLYARASTSPRQSFRHLEKAVEDNDGQALKYFGTWIDQALLGSSADSDFFRQKTVELLNQSKNASVEFWLRAGRLAYYWEMNDLATRCYRTVLDRDPENTSARLQLARLALESGRLSKTESLLEEYFFEATEHRPTYWWLKGRLFEARGADSEAYVAYSHVVNNYPDSLLLPRVERRIKELTLPENLYSDTTPEPREDEQTAEARSAGPVFRVQVGSFREKNQAEQFKKQLLGEFDRPAVVKQAEVEGELFYRVRVGAARDKSGAVELKSQLQSAGYQGYVTSSD